MNFKIWLCLFIEITLILLCLFIEITLIFIGNHVINSNLKPFKPILVFNSNIPCIFYCEGIMLFPFIFFYNSKKYYINTHKIEIFIKHELIHYNQVLREGFFNFYIKYLFFLGIGLFKNRFDFVKAYHSIIYEKEAHRNEILGLTGKEKKIYY